MKDPQTATPMQQLQAALAKEYAWGWDGIYNDDTKQRLAEEQARNNIHVVWRAVTSLGWCKP